jgi:phage baseplate assembly protein gpV
MLVNLVTAIVTNNEDPIKLGRVKFKSDELLGGKEHPNWAEPQFPVCDGSSAVFMVPKIGASIQVILPSGSIDNPVYLGAHPLKPEDVPDEVKQDYPNRAIIKFRDMGYVLFDAKNKVITVLSTGDVKVVSATDVYFETPLFEVGKKGLTADDGIVRKADLQKAIDDLKAAVDAKFAVCAGGSGVGAISRPTAEASAVGLCLK